MLDTFRSKLTDRWNCLLSYIHPRVIRPRVFVNGEDSQGFDIEEHVPDKPFIKKTYAQCVTYRAKPIRWTIDSLERSTKGMAIYVLRDPESGKVFRISRKMLDELFDRI